MGVPMSFMWHTLMESVRCGQPAASRSQLNTAATPPFASPARTRLYNKRTRVCCERRRACVLTRLLVMDRGCAHAPASLPPAAAGLPGATVWRHS
ncbi:hypothetical protein EON67_05575 [archaeon]|nr:MAG: hypothetical protein EON67_05575 [archaeon]